VTVDVVLEQEQFLPHEGIIASVRITNFSGQTLHLGQNEEWLRIAVEGADGFVVERLGPVPVKTAFDVESGRVGTRRVNITPYFNLSKLGRYLVQATIELPELSQTVSSKHTKFDIIAGTKLWEQVVGIPKPPGQEGAPAVVRKFALQQANYLKEMRLYARLSDADEGSVYSVFPLGPMVSFSRPEVQVDRMSQMHVLYQTGARACLYAVVSPMGEILVRQTHEITTTRPGLKVNSEGGIYVSGGVRRVTRGDLPVAPPIPPKDTPGTVAPARKPELR
jgi:hypothetical protein